MLSAEQMKILATSEEFQKFLAQDPVLEALEAKKYDSRAEYGALADVFSFHTAFYGLEIPPLTPALWAYLWATRNNYAHDIAAVVPPDTDIFLFLLVNGLRNLEKTPAQVAAAAAGYCEKWKLDYGKAHEFLCSMIVRAFKPLEMLPAANGSPDGPNVFDADWLTRICSIVSRETGEKVSDVMFDMSLHACCCYFIQAMRRHDTKHLIRRKTDGEICGEIYRRVMELAAEYLESRKHEHEDDEHGANRNRPDHGGEGKPQSKVD